MKRQTVLRTKGNKQTSKPIGIFDSGLGGLTVAKEIFRQLPYEDVIYFGDTARVPYGNKSKKTITKFSLQNAAFLKKHKVKLIIVACNTACSLSLSELKKKIDIPVVGVIEPAVKKALEISKNRRIGIIGTNSTVNSQTYNKKISKIDKRVKVFSKSCPLFVPLAEEGWLDEKITYDIAKAYLDYLKKKKIDTLILACTHYPLLKKVIKRVVGKKVQLIDSASEVAKVVKVILGNNMSLQIKNKKPKYSYYVSDEPLNFAKVGAKFLGQNIKKVRRSNNEL
jgi:glutamate racemase